MFGASEKSTDASELQIEKRRPSEESSDAGCYPPISIIAVSSPFIHWMGEAPARNRGQVVWFYAGDFITRKPQRAGLERSQHSRTWAPVTPATSSSASAQASGCLPTTVSIGQLNPL